MVESVISIVSISHSRRHGVLAPRVVRHWHCVLIASCYDKTSRVHLGLELHRAESLSQYGRQSRKPRAHSFGFKGKQKEYTERKESDIFQSSPPETNFLQESHTSQASLNSTTAGTQCTDFWSHGDISYANHHRSHWALMGVFVSRWRLEA